MVNETSTAANEHAENEVWISIRTVAERVGRSLVTVHKWIGDPDVQFPRGKLVRNRRYFLKSEIVRWEKRFPDRLGAQARAA